jgi:hypothetical protein
VPAEPSHKKTIKEKGNQMMDNANHQGLGVVAKHGYLKDN